MIKRKILEHFESQNILPDEKLQNIPTENSNNKRIIGTKVFWREGDREKGWLFCSHMIFLRSKFNPFFVF